MYLWLTLCHMMEWVAIISQKLIVYISDKFAYAIYMSWFSKNCYNFIILTLKINGQIFLESIFYYHLVALVSSGMDAAVHISIMVVTKEMIFGHIEAVVRGPCVLFSQLFAIARLTAFFPLDVWGNSVEFHVSHNNNGNLFHHLNMCNAGSHRLLFQSFHNCELGISFYIVNNNQLVF